MFKNFLLSKTLWFNAFSIAIMLIQAKFGFIVDASVQLTVIALINLILRQFTKSGITLDLKPVSLDPADVKNPFTSKTFWVNGLAMIFLAIQHFTGYAVPVDKQIELLALVNMVLRCFTKVPIGWTADGEIS
jgi:nitrate reductase gamma subunit